MAAKNKDTSANVAIGARIRRQRLKLDMSLRGLSTHLGVSTVQLRNYETGYTRISAVLLLRIAAALNISIDDLLGMSGSADRAAPFRLSWDEQLSGIRSPAVRNALAQLLNTIEMEIRRG